MLGAPKVTSAPIQVLPWSFRVGSPRASSRLNQTMPSNWRYRFDVALALVFSAQARPAALDRAKHSSAQRCSGPTQQKVQNNQGSGSSIGACVTDLGSPVSPVSFSGSSCVMSGVIVMSRLISLDNYGSFSCKAKTRKEYHWMTTIVAPLDGSSQRIRTTFGATAQDHCFLSQANRRVSPGRKGCVSKESCSSWLQHPLGGWIHNSGCNPPNCKELPQGL